MSVSPTKGHNKSDTDKIMIFLHPCLPPAYDPASLVCPSRTIQAKSRSTPIVGSQPMQASMRLTPLFTPARPLFGTNSWLLVHRFDSIMIPTMLFSPAYSWSIMLLATSDWSLWSLQQLFVGKESQRLQSVRPLDGGCLPSTHYASNPP